MKEKVNVAWTGKMAFDASIGDHTITIDADQEVGGERRGPKPKLLLMVALGGCTGMDVVSILKKMRVDFERFEVEVEGDIDEIHPKKYNKIIIRYMLEGNDIPADKVQKAVKLSEENYCGVSATLRNCVEMKSEIWLNGQMAR